MLTLDAKTYNTSRAKVIKLATRGASRDKVLGAARGILNRQLAKDLLAGVKVPSKGDRLWAEPGKVQRLGIQDIGYGSGLPDSLAPAIGNLEYVGNQDGTTTFKLFQAGRAVQVTKAGSNLTKMAKDAITGLVGSESVQTVLTGKPRTEVDFTGQTVVDLFSKGKVLTLTALTDSEFLSAGQNYLVIGANHGQLSLLNPLGIDGRAQSGSSALDGQISVTDLGLSAKLSY